MIRIRQGTLGRSNPARATAAWLTTAAFLATLFHEPVSAQTGIPACPPSLDINTATAIDGDAAACITEPTGGCPNGRPVASLRIDEESKWAEVTWDPPPTAHQAVVDGVDFGWFYDWAYSVNFGIDDPGIQLGPGRPDDGPPTSVFSHTYEEHLGPGLIVAIHNQASGDGDCSGAYVFEFDFAAVEPTAASVGEDTASRASTRSDEDQLDELAEALPESSPVRQARERGISWPVIAAAAGLTVAAVFAILATDIALGGAASALARRGLRILGQTASKVLRWARRPQRGGIGAVPPSGRGPKRLDPRAEERRLQDLQTSNPLSDAKARPPKTNRQIEEETEDLFKRDLDLDG